MSDGQAIDSVDLANLIVFSSLPTSCRGILPEQK